MPAVIAPNLQMKFTNNNGLPLSGGKVFTYIAGTNTKLATYTDETGSVPNANPTILDAAGEANIWLRAGMYKFVIKDANDNIIKTIDRVAGYGSGGSGGGSGVIRALNAGKWFAPAGSGAIKAEENGFEVFKFSFESEQEVNRVIPVPHDYAGGPIFMELALYSPSISNAFRFEVETTLVNPDEAFSDETNQYTEQFAITLDNPSDRMSIVPVYLSPEGKVNEVTIQPKARLKVKVKRISTLPDEEGPDDTEDVRLLNDSEEVVTA